MSAADHLKHPLARTDVLPGRGRLPLLLSVPHSGRDYPRWLLDLSRRGGASLEPLEDPFVDRLVWRVQALGVGAVIARAPRAAIDCNRSPAELDTSIVAAAPDGDPGIRARSGLGIVPARTPQHGELWRRKVTRGDYEARIAQVHAPYHQALADELAALHRAHAEVLLLDCHSMPPRAGTAPSIVLGDRHGASCAPWLGDLARRSIEQAGVPAAFNDPYAGGWIVERHGRPAEGIHALQIEIDRRLYLDQALRQPGPGFDGIARLLESLAATLGEALLDRHRLPLAAE